MIRVDESALWPGELVRATAHAVPWRAAPPGRLAFATLWCTGAQPERDALLRLAALRRAPDGRWESFTTTCRAPRSEGARLAADFGIRAHDLADAAEPARALSELHAYLAGTSVITSARDTFLAWWRSSGNAPVPHVVDLAQIAALCRPGRLADEGETLASSLCVHAPAAGPRALEPAHLRAALGALAARVLAQDEPVLALLAHALGAAGRALEREGPRRDMDVALVLGLLEHPSLWRDPALALEPGSDALRDGRLSMAARELPDLDAALAAARPRWKRPGGQGSEATAVRIEGERTLDEDDRRRIEEIFQERLPRHLQARGDVPAGAGYRIGQHGVASVISAGFGRRELRLVHAPTGTGKTLAYLVPTALWAFRNGARVGIATFTRVLQEQAMTREVPLALELLRAGADATGIRVTVLKGRENYLCWRALCLQARADGDPADEILAWAALALFALHDDAGDLDRFPSPGTRAAERLLRAVRCQAGCCTHATDRATCAAEAALRAAERAHVVLTNHALALARRDFFHHLVFDECEHLHDVALNAFSASASLRELSETIARLQAGDERRPLERVAVLAPEGSEAAAQAALAGAAAEDARAALAELGAQCQAFKAWRARAMRERTDADQHSLFREYTLADGGAGLLASHADLAAALRALVTGLARLQECLDGVLPAREAPRLRRALDVLRVELEEVRAAVAAWIPRDARGRAAFGHESFHDLETTANGDDLLVTRVLLPHEHLGRHYYPTLGGAVLLSATTWLRGGFESAAAYLGLARAAEPAPDEEREPVPFHSFCAPEAFDYSRVLVGVPRDAPAVHDKAAYLEYVARFIAFVAERTRGRMLALFTSAEDVAAVGTRLEPFFAARRLPFWWQRMRGTTKEELGRLFRAHVDSVLLGLDTFWYGADFPGATLEYLVIARLPYGVPDRYHHAQCAVLGTPEQRRTIYLPRAFAKFRQGFGRLMRKESDRGCVFVLDRRALDPRHRAFMQELPVRTAWAAHAGGDGERLARLVSGDSDTCIDEGLAHMRMQADVRRRGLEARFEGWQPPR